MVGDCAVMLAILINMTLNSAAAPITLIQNWNPEGAR
jgi:hypothetical protein